MDDSVNYPDPASQEWPSPNAAPTEPAAASTIAPAVESELSGVPQADETTEFIADPTDLIATRPQETPRSPWAPPTGVAPSASYAQTPTSPSASTIPTYPPPSMPSSMPSYPYPSDPQPLSSTATVYDRTQASGQFIQTDSYRPRSEYEAPSVGATPMAPTPVNPSPITPIPIETSPIATTPIETTPIETTPIETTPMETSRIETLRIDTSFPEPTLTAPTSFGSAETTSAQSWSRDADSSWAAPSSGEGVPTWSNGSSSGSSGAAGGSGLFGSDSASPRPPMFPSASGSAYSSSGSGSYNTGAPGTPTSSGSSKEASKGSRSWLKPALAGGLIGALVSSGVLGAALVTTRNDSNKPSIISSNAASTATGAANIAVNPADGVPGILAKVQPSVVTINTKGFDTNFGVFNVEPQEGTGTGIVLTADGYILTNAHVIANAASIKVAFPGEKDRKVMSANVVGRDPENDVAVVKIDGVKDLKPAKLGVSADTIVGEPVVAVGNALGLPGGSTVTTGIISAIERTIEGDGQRLEGLLQTDAAINPGNSGGPLVNGRGEVIGMNTAIIQNSNNIGFAIAIDRIKPIVERIEKGDSVTTQRTFLGVSTQTMDSTIQNQYGLATDTGALVVDVTVGSPADGLGLRAGDIITKFDGQTITTNKDLSDLVRKKKPGNKVVVEWKRGDQTEKGTATLGSARSIQQG